MTDPAYVDQQFATLQQKSAATGQAIESLMTKLQVAATGGDSAAREWSLDLREVALAVHDEENQANALLSAIHAMVDAHVQAQPAGYPAAPQAGYQQVPSAQPPAAGYAPAGGGMLQRFLGGGFGRAIASGAGFGIGDQLIQDIL